MSPIEWAGSWSGTGSNCERRIAGKPPPISSTITAKAGKYEKSSKPILQSAGRRIAPFFHTENGRCRCNGRNGESLENPGLRPKSGAFVRESDRGERPYCRRLHWCGQSGDRAPEVPKDA